jgi:predicted nucleotidyltransferase
MKLFRVDFLEKTWKYGGLKLFRAEKLYTAQNYQVFLETFRNNFPGYVYFCPFRQKEVLSTPLDSIDKVFVPRDRLRVISQLRRKDPLQRMTLDFVDLVSRTSGIAHEDFGVHGSVSLNMHTNGSDIDIVVYGSRNFRKLEATIDRLVEVGDLSYLFNNRLDAARRFKGKYRDRIFMYNAIRKTEEVKAKYGSFRYSPTAPVGFTCIIREDSEAMFRPAIYEIEDYQPARQREMLPTEKIPRLVISMIGCYRNVARRGDRVQVSGMLEQVENLETGEVFHQVVVGTGISEEEYIWPL